MDNIIAGIIIIVAVGAVYFVWKKTRNGPIGAKLKAAIDKIKNKKEE